VEHFQCLWFCIKMLRPIGSMSYT